MALGGGAAGVCPRRYDEVFRWDFIFSLSVPSLAAARIRTKAYESGVIALILPSNKHTHTHSAPYTRAGGLVFDSDKAKGGHKFSCATQFARNGGTKPAHDCRTVVLSCSEWPICAARSPHVGVDDRLGLILLWGQQSAAEGSKDAQILPSVSCKESYCPTPHKKKTR